MKLNERREAINLRRKGISYDVILKTVNVSKSTLSLWLRDVILTSNARKRALRGRELSRYAAAMQKKRIRESNTNEIVQKGREESKILVENPLFLTGLCLYWAEGDKHKQERVKFTNSDEKMIVLMMRWFREICGVSERKFRIAVHIHNLHKPRNVERYWSRITRVSEKQFQKTYIKQSSLRYRRNVLYNGTCAIVVNNKALFRRIRGWRLGLLDYFNISP